MNIKHSSTIAISLSIGLTVICLWLLPGISQIAQAQPGADIIHVANGGADTAGCGGVALPCATIRYALDMAEDGDIIQVAQGIYSGTLIITRSVSLLGGYEAVDWTRSIPTYTTVISGNLAGPVIQITNSSTATVEGFDIVAGQAANGGGFMITDAYPTITSNRIHDNQATSNGGGIYLSSAGTALTPLVISNTIYGNMAGVGGGVYLYSTCELSGNEIRNNTASSGGGLSIAGPVAATPRLMGNSIHDNSTTSAGGGVYISGGTPRLERNAITGNHIGGYQHGAGIYIYSNSTVYVVSNTIAYNATPFGWGGGIYVAWGLISILDNDIHHNQAGNPAYRMPDGGGIHIEGASGGTIAGNTIHDNWAVDQGGGIFSKSSVQVSNNRIENNSASIGGGLSLWGSGAAGQIAGNTIAQNNGGGIYLWYYACPTISANTITANSGGGLIIVDGAAPAVSANLILSNTASYGGGVQIGGNAQPILTNNVLRGNQAGVFGGGLFISSAFPQLLHNTLALNGASSIYVTDNSQIALVNTIIVSESVGITVTAGSTATVAGVLWFGNEVDSGGEGTITVTDAYYGDPAFVPDGYHLTTDSAALDRGVPSNVATDIDSDSRPAGPAFDLGADEFLWPPSAVTISGPLTVLLNTPYSLTATVTPSVAATPITYVWQSTYHDPMTRMGNLSNTVTFTWPVTGIQMITVTAKNVAGEVAATHVLTVADVPIAGLNAATSSPTILGQVTFFTASVSAGTNITYMWDFGDGQFSVGANATHAYEAAGSYTAVVTATNSNNSDSAITAVTIINNPPVANAGDDQSVAANSVVILDGTDSSDPDGHVPLTYGWTQTGGPVVMSSDSTTVTSSFIGPSVPTILTFTLTVTDSFGLADPTPDEVVIRVMRSVYLPLILCSSGTVD